MWDAGKVGRSSHNQRVRTWTITHPDLGLIEVIEAHLSEVTDIDPGWPDFPVEDDEKAQGGGSAESQAEQAESEGPASEVSEPVVSHGVEPPDGDGVAEGGDSIADQEKAEKGLREAGRDNDLVSERLGSRAGFLEWVGRRKLPAPVRDWFIRAASRCRENAGMVLLVRMNGVVYGRVGSIQKHRSTELTTPLSKGVILPVSIAIDNPRVLYTANANGELVTVALVADDGKVLLDPQPGTYAHARWQAMEVSPWKRLIFPILTGLGKVGGALAGILLAPVMAAVLSWLGTFVPHIDLPSIPWPHITLPKIPWPDITLPSIPFPDIHLPSLPGWMDWWIENTKLWVPIVVGIVLGVSAFVTSSRSKKRRARWEQQSKSGNEDQGPLVVAGDDERTPAADPVERTDEA